MDKNKTGIMYLMDYMDKAFDYCAAKISNRDHDTELNNMINAVIDIFLVVNKRTLSDPAWDAQQISTQLADKLVEVAEDINSNNFENLLPLFCKETESVFSQWREIIQSHYKYKIIVCGLTPHYMLLPQIINTDRAEIIAYSDDNGANIGKYIQNVEIIDIRQIHHYEYDYLLLLGGIKDETLNELINEGKLHSGQIFNFARHFLIDSDCQFYTKYYDFMDGDKNYEGFITGLSHFECGINTKFLKKSFFNFAVASQDLFFDYKLLNYALGFENFKKSIKYVIIGMPYFGFGYDISKSKNFRTIRTEIYYPVLGTVHNYENGEDFKNKYAHYKNICSKVFRHDYSRIIYNSVKHGGLKTLEEAGNSKFNSSKLTEEERESFINDVKKECKDRYPLTIKENIEIMKEYLQCLSSNNIKSIILCCPLTKLYRDNASREVQKQFYNIISELKGSYEFQFIDYFESEEFDDEDFFDISHLNYRGAKKFTNILNDIIEW